MDKVGLGLSNLSTSNNNAAGAVATNQSETNNNATKTSNDQDQWDDMVTQKKVTSASAGGAGTVELLDMKALDSKRRGQDDIAERMRVEETKAKLAAAREGMEKEAQRLAKEKEEKQVKKQASAAPASSRFGAAAANLTDPSATRWVPSHLRNAREIPPSRNTASSSTGYQRNVNMDDEELFPDLATADKIIAQEEQQQQLQRKREQELRNRQKISSSTWGAKKKSTTSSVPKKSTNTSTPPPTSLPVKKSTEPDTQSTIVPETKSAPEAAAPAVAPVTPAPKPLKKKKKKKDLSTFNKS